MWRDALHSSFACHVGTATASGERVPIGRDAGWSARVSRSEASFDRNRRPISVSSSSLNRTGT
jgi:hypothetical protein